MVMYSVDSDAVLAATAAVRATGDRLQGETAAMLAQLTQLQGSWTGGAAVAFQSVIDRWRVAQHEVESALTDISGALAVAGQHYAETELAAAGLFR
ncbi:WXG100 family type VII secretion target [Microbacterium sp.]|uniref:WXG100 family type VII secretion target n=1 Tax=Microbacterium sp. TaxID=51671 RepID=UPI0039E21C40